jgi:APA family basic amino acid/polyamine antiporter
MARQGLLPRMLGRVHAGRRTPHVAIAVLLAIAAGLVLLGNIAQLASATVLLLLIVFTVVNGALVVLKLQPNEKPGAFEVPIIVPALGAVVCVSLLINRLLSDDWRAPAIAGGIIASIVGLYALTRPRHVSDETIGAAEPAT